MSDQVYCYHCRRHHPADQVTPVYLRGIRRWRCRRSIALSQASSAARDAFGRAVSEAQRALRGVRPLPRPVLELFNSPGVAA